MQVHKNATFTPSSCNNSWHTPFSRAKVTQTTQAQARLTGLINSKIELQTIISLAVTKQQHILILKIGVNNLMVYCKPDRAAIDKEENPKEV